MNDEFIRGWLQSETAEQDKIMVKRVYIDINDGYLADGVIFSQIMYWFGLGKNGKPRVQVEKDNYLWLVRRDEDWWEDCRVSARTARDSIARIVQRGLIIKARYKWNGAPTTHIRPDWQAFKIAIRNIQIASNGTDGKRQMELDQNVKSMELTENVKPLTDTDTTSEKTKAGKPARSKSGTIKPEQFSIDSRHPKRDSIVKAWLAVTTPIEFNLYSARVEAQKLVDAHYDDAQVRAYCQAQVDRGYAPSLSELIRKLPTWLKAQAKTETPVPSSEDKAYIDRLRAMARSEFIAHLEENNLKLLPTPIIRQELMRRDMA